MTVAIENTVPNKVEGQRSRGAELPLCSSSPLPLCSLITTSLFLVSLTLYLTTLAPSVFTLFDDSLEFQLVTYQLGIAHPTGYPFYTLLGKLFSFIPLGDVAYRVNLMSAVFGAATVALLYPLILQIIPPRVGRRAFGTPPVWPVHLGAVTGALLLAVGLVFWQQATIAEVYTLNALFVALLLLLAASLPYAPPRQQEQRLLWLAFIGGLSLTHHRTILLLFPALGLYLLLYFRPLIFKPKILLLMIMVGLLPLLLYLYLPLRGHVGSLDGTYENSWAGFWRQVSAGGYGVFIFGNPFGQARDLAFYWNLLAGQFYTTVPGLIGLIYLFRLGQPKMVVLTGLAFLTYFTFNLFYNVADIEVFFIPVFLIWAAWSGLGVAFLLHTFATFRYVKWRPVVVAFLLGIFLFMLGQLFQTNRQTVADRYNWQIHDYGLDMLQQPLPPDNAVVVGILGEMTLLRYFQQTENRRPDIETVAADLEANRLAAVATALEEGKTVYLTRELPGVTALGSLNAVGPLIRVDPEPRLDAPDVEVVVRQPVTSGITLLGYNVSRPSHTDPGPAPVRLTLFWQAEVPIPADLKVSARLLDEAGKPVAVVDAAPVHFTYPTTAWRPGEVVSDVYDLRLPLDAPPGQYLPLIIWYDPARNGAEVGRIELAPVMIE